MVEMDINMGNPIVVTLAHEKKSASWWFCSQDFTVYGFAFGTGARRKISNAIRYS